MLEWFSHKCIGDEVNIMEPFSHLCNDWIGIAVCVVFCCLPRHQIQSDYPVLCRLTINGKVFNSVLGKMVFLSDHIELFYLLPQFFKDEEYRKPPWECDANGFREIGIKITKGPLGLVKKCGLHVIYKKDRRS